MQNPPQEPQGPQGPQGTYTGPLYPPRYPTQPTPQYLPQQPAYPSLYPSPQPQNVYFQNQSFTNKAVIAFLLYWVGYVPGLIFNIMYLMEARRVEGETGRTPSGYGCLWATLIGSLVPAALLLMVCFLLFAAAASGGASAH